MGLTSLALKFAAPPPKLTAFSRFLFIGPHPDDIEIGAGATAAALTAAGKSVSFLICTDGRYGMENAPEGTTPEALIATRQAECRASAETLGVRDLQFLGLSDGAQYSREALLRGAHGELSPTVTLHGHTHNGRGADSLAYGGTVTAEVRYSHAK